MKRNVAIKINGLKKNFGDTAVLHDIHLTIHQGELVGIVGDSGSGKTTLLNLIGGMDFVTAGDIWVGKNNIARFNDEERTIYRREHVGFIFQNYNLVHELTVYENIIMPLQLRNQFIDKKLIVELLTKVNMLDKINAYPSQLSGGEQQRVAILRAVISDSEIVLADEPTGSLDSTHSEAVIDLIKNLSITLNKTILLVTHNNEIASRCDRVIKIKDGEIIMNKKQE